MCGQEDGEILPETITSPDQPGPLELFFLLEVKDYRAHNVEFLFLSWSYFSSRLIPVTQPEDIDPNLVLDNGWSYFEYRVHTLKPGCWNTKKGDDKETSPGRPPLYVFPWKPKGVNLIKGEAILTCRFLMLTLTGEFTAGLDISAFFAVKN